MAEHREQNWDKIEWKERWKVVGRSVNPAIEDVMVTVWESFVLLEPGCGSGSVKFLGTFLTKWKPDDVKAGFLGLLDPLLVRSLLDTGCWPVPGVLRLSDIESLSTILFSEPHCHDAVGAVTSSTPHDKWVKSIWAEDCEEVTRFDKALIDVNIVCLTALNLESHRLLDEFDVRLCHVGWNMGTDDWNSWMVGKSTDEDFKCCKNRLEFIDDVIAEVIDLNTTEGEVSLSFSSVHLQRNPVGSARQFIGKVENLRVCDEEFFVTEE